MSEVLAIRGRFARLSDEQNTREGTTPNPTTKEPCKIKDTGYENESKSSAAPLKNQVALKNTIPRHTSHRIKHPPRVQ